MTIATTDQLLCRAGGQLHAVPIDGVIEIMRPLPVQPIAGAAFYVRGLAVIRGAAVPVVDTGLLVGDRPAQAGRLVAVRAGQRTVALQVDAVLGIRSFDVATFNALPPLLRDAPADAIASIGALDTELMVTLHSARIVPEGASGEPGARP